MSPGGESTCAGKLRSRRNLKVLYWGTFSGWALNDNVYPVIKGISLKREHSAIFDAGRSHIAPTTGEDKSFHNWWLIEEIKRNKWH